MAQTAKKITLSPSRDIPFTQLTLSQANVRKIKSGISIEELAEDIARRGLLQSLNVRPVLTDDGSETGMFEVPAGGRRYQALALLVKQKRLNKTAAIPCVVRDPACGILAEDDSLAENIQRVPLHPLDQFRAFQTLRDKGQSVAEIAGAFFTSEAVVRQRLKLASVAPSLLEAYGADEMVLEQLMAFTVNPDHGRQEQVWAAIRDSWQKEPWQIRRMLTETTIRASDRRAVFVGEAAYIAAGGTVLRDLFEQDQGGWWEDPALTERLVAEKLAGIAEDLRAQGWKWVQTEIDLPYGFHHGLCHLVGQPEPLSPEDQAEAEALVAEQAGIEAEYGEADDLPDEVHHRLDEIETRLAEFEDRPLSYTAEDMAMAGVFVSLDREGIPVFYRGWVRPEDEPGQTPEGDAETSTDQAVQASGSADPAPAPVEDEEEDSIKPLPDRLVAELTAHRTLALRDAFADHPDIALTALLHRLVRDHFGRVMQGGASLEVTLRSVHFPAQIAGLNDSAPAKAIQERHEAWAGDLPQEDQALWDYLQALDLHSRLALLAHCLSFGVNALYEKPNPYSASGVSQSALERRLREADRLAVATHLDMVEAGWRPMVENYLGRVTKPRILEAVREGAGEQAAGLIDHLKKADMAREAERLLDGSGWLPEPLRRAGPDAEPAAPAETDLPAFLSGGDDSGVEIAAE